MIANIYYTFAIAILPLVIYMKLWRSSVSTFLFVLAAAWCAITSQMMLGDESIRFGVMLVIEVYAIIRAIAKPATDTWKIGGKSSASC